MNPQELVEMIYQRLKRPGLTLLYRLLGDDVRRLTFAETMARGFDGPSILLFLEIEVLRNIPLHSAPPDGACYEVNESIRQRRIAFFVEIDLLRDWDAQARKEPFLPKEWGVW